MDTLIILAIAIGLAMDAFSVSIAYGIKAKCKNTDTALTMASSFGAFQAFLPVLGWFAGVKMLDFIAGFDHWLAFALLLIGCKMIYESTKPEAQRKTKPLNTCVLLALSIATSIDALAVGLSFAFLKVSIITPIIIIGAVTFTLSFEGAILGDKLSRFKPNKIEILGGLILIAIGTKILTEHLTWS
ncbi:MAG: manganese efflux pump MntP [Candidatus Bathycorpusculaceae bacterium]